MSEQTKRRAIGELCFAEQILVWGTRAWLAGPDGRARLRAELTGALGEEIGGATATALGAFLTVFNSAALRTMYIGPMACRMVWPDEERILAAIRYLHADLHDAAERALDQVLPAAAQRVALAHGAALADLLAGAGYRIGFGGPLQPDVADALIGVPRPTVH